MSSDAEKDGNAIIRAIILRTDFMLPMCRDRERLARVLISRGLMRRRSRRIAEVATPTLRRRSWS